MKKSCRILLTGASGELGQAILASGRFKNILAPSRRELDISRRSSVRNYLNRHTIDGVIHCAAVSRMAQCEADPVLAIQTNIIGTSHLVQEVLELEARQKRTVRFIHLSTDGVYKSTQGRYSEKSPTIPYNKYGWTKLGAETAVNLLSNFCILRTRFFDPQKIPFTKSATDAFSCSLPKDQLVEVIEFFMSADFIGTVNVGNRRQSDYQRYRKFKPALKPCRLDDILNSVSFAMSEDASLNLRLLKRLRPHGSKTNS